MRQTPPSTWITAPQPIIVIGSGESSFRGEQAATRAWAIELYSALLDSTLGTLALLDGAPTLAHARVRSVRRDWGLAAEKDIVALAADSQLVILIDDEHRELSATTSTPVLRIWHNKSPSEIDCPGPQILNVICTDRPDDWFPMRWSVNVVEFGVDGPSVAEILQLANDMLAGADFGLPPHDVARTAQLKHYLRRCRQRTPLAEYADRHLTFHRLFHEMGQRFADPIIAETGCVRATEDWSAGYSSYLFGAYLTARETGHLHSIDYTAGNLRFAKAITAPFADRITFHESDSVEWLRNNHERIDVLYLDSMDVGVAGYEDHGLAEARAAEAKLQPAALILVDDTVWDGGWKGKGAKSIPWLNDQGWQILLAGYQVLLSR